MGSSGVFLCSVCEENEAQRKVKNCPRSHSKIMCCSGSYSQVPVYTLGSEDQATLLWDSTEPLWFFSLDEVLQKHSPLAFHHSFTDLPHRSERLSTYCCCLGAACFMTHPTDSLHYGLWEKSNPALKGGMGNLGIHFFSQ